MKGLIRLIIALLTVAVRTHDLNLNHPGRETAIKILRRERGRERDAKWKDLIRFIRALFTTIQIHVLNLNHPRDCEKDSRDKIF